MVKKFLRANENNLLIVFFLLMILPFVAITIFNHPSADDFFYSEKVKTFGFWSAQIKWYKFWTGRFFSTALLSLTPLIYKSVWGYKLLVLSMMLLLFYVFYLFISEFTEKKLLKKEKITLTLSVLFLYLYALPTVSQGLYWLPAIFVYNSAIILILIFLILYNKYKQETKTVFKIYYFIIFAIIITFNIGSNEIAMMLISVMILLLFISEVINTRKVSSLMVLLILIIIGVSYIVIAAPGNYYRNENFPGRHQIFSSLYITSEVLVKLLFSWIFLSPLLAVAVLLLPLLVKIISDRSNKLIPVHINPVLSLVLYLGLLFMSIFIFVWSTGKIPFDRTLNFIYFIFLAGFFYNIITLLYYYSAKKKIVFKKSYRYISIIAFAVICLLLIRKNNIRNVYADLLLNTAFQYDVEMNQRYDFILQNNSDSVTVRNIDRIPRTLFFRDIETDVNNDLNKWYAHYFNKKAITLEKPELK